MSSGSPMRPIGIALPRSRLTSGDIPLRVDRAGDQPVDAHAVGTEVDRHGAGERFDAAFGGIVGGVAAVGPGGAAGGDIDDDPLALPRHVLGGAQAAEKAPFEIDGVDAVPPVLVAVEEVPLGVDQPGAVDQHVDRAEALQRLIEEAIDRRLVRDIGGDGDRRAASRVMPFATASAPSALTSETTTVAPSAP